MKHIPDNRRIYHHWGYDPSSDAVYLNDESNHDINGYAYRIDGGWRLTDREHDSIDDPFIIRKVMTALNQSPDEGDSFTPRDYNFSKLHYGQPLPRER